jgi:hypothetical protein
VLQERTVHPCVDELHVGLAVRLWMGSRQPHLKGVFCRKLERSIGGELGPRVGSFHRARQATGQWSALLVNSIREVIVRRR